MDNMQRVKWAVNSLVKVWKAISHQHVIVRPQIWLMGDSLWVEASRFSGFFFGLYLLSRCCPSSSPATRQRRCSQWVNKQTCSWHQMFSYILSFYLETCDIWGKKTLSSITLQETRSVLSPPPSPHPPLSLHISQSFLLANWQQLTPLIPSLDLMGWTISSRTGLWAATALISEGRLRDNVRVMEVGMPVKCFTPLHFTSH